MNLDNQWPIIEEVFKRAIAASRHCAIASVSEAGIPHVTPIGYVFLRSNKTAFYFEKHSKKLPENFQHNPNVCIMFVNNSPRFWLKALITKRFDSYPGMRLIGKVGPTREATQEELGLLSKRIGPLKKLPGAKLIWSDLHVVRDVQITAADAVTYPKMMEHLL